MTTKRPLCSTHLRGLAAVLAFLGFSGCCRAEDPPEKLPRGRVGQIFIVGNTKTRMNIILDKLSLYPGQIFAQDDLKNAEKSLVRLDRFVIDPIKGIRPTVTVLDNPNDPTGEYKDIVVTVTEKPSRSFYHVLYDVVDEWGYLVDIRFRVAFPLMMLDPLYQRYCR